MSQFNWKDKFPKLRPIYGPPALNMMNGTGTSIFGTRDYDPETGSYVTTHCFCILFVPLVALGAYRVADAGGGRYYFLGKEPLSAFSRLWNAALLLVALTVGGMGGLWAWSNSEGGKATLKLAQADRLVRQGQVRAALPLLKSLVVEDTPKRGEAHTRLENWVSLPAMAGAKANDCLPIWRTAVEISHAGRWDYPPQTLGRQGLNLASSLAEEVPADALALIAEAVPLLNDPKAHVTSIRYALDKMQARQPGDVNVAVQLATTFEWEGNDERCEEILAPLKDKLGETDGARILGQIAARRGEFDPAYRLLSKYCEARLPAFRAAEAAWNSALDGVREQALADLQTEKARGFDYRRYQGQTEEQKAQMVSDFLETRIKQNAEANTLRTRLASLGAVVPAALDLGMLQLQRGQSLQGEERTAELERAEKTFLAIGNVASNAPGYKLNLGKVYYWLGKQEEGKKLLDEALSAAGKSDQQRYEVAAALRDVGAETDARALAETIYETASEPGAKSAAARMRAAMYKDVDDQIQWLLRASQTDPEVRASLAQAKGQKALSQGNKEEGIRQLRLAADAYAAMPPTSATLNNGALSHVTLFRISGQKAELDQAVQLLDKAAALTPDDSMLMINAGETNLTRALAEILDSYVHLEVLSIESDLDVLRFLYEDASGREAIVEELRSSPQLARAVQLLERAVLLAPKRAENYTSLLELYAYQDDAAGLKRLQQRIEEVHPDVARQRQEAIDWAAGKEREDRLQRVIAGEANCRQLYDRWKSEPAGAKRDRSLAIAAGQLAMFALGRETLGDKVDLGEAIKLAEEGVALTPTSAGRFRLIYLLQSRAHEELAAQLPAYGQYAAAARPVLSPSLTLLLALEHESLRAAICEHPDMRRSADLYAQERQRFPQSPSTWDWFVLRYSHAEQAESIRTAALADECDRLSGEIQVRLFPFSVNAVLLRHAHLACAGKDVEARQLWKSLRDEGIPIQDDVLLP